MEGYDFEIVGDDFPDWKCPICLLLLRQAMLLPCSHSACKTCLMKWENEGDSGVFRCPSCQTIYQREKVHSGTEGRFVDRLITTSLKVKCKEPMKRCDWVGTISDYEDHLKICDYLDITCPQLGCEKFLKRKDLPSHITSDCEYVEVACPFEGMGCTHKVLRKDFDDHVNNSSQQHTNVLLHFTLKLTKEVKCFKEANIELRMEMEQLKQSCTSRICGLEKKLEQKENEIIAVNKKVDNIKKQFHQKTDKSSKDVKALSTKIIQLEDTLAKNEKKSKEGISSTKKKIEDPQAVANMKSAAVMSLSSKERSKKWTFEDLLRLIENNENERFAAIINLKPELAVLSGGECTLLHAACRYNSPLCIDVLIKNGCPINHENNGGEKPIHWAAVNGSVDAAKKLLSINATLVNSVNTKNKWTPLQYAAVNDQEEFVRYILMGPVRKLINVKDCWNRMTDEFTASPRIRVMILVYFFEIIVNNPEMCFIFVISVVTFYFWIKLH